MSKKRVHELAKEYGLENKDVLLKLQAAGVDVKSHSSSVYEDEARAVLGKAKVEEPVAPPPAAAPKRPGMMIVKKKSEIAAAEAAHDATSAHAQFDEEPAEAELERTAAPDDASYAEPEPSYEQPEHEEREAAPEHAGEAAAERADEPQAAAPMPHQPDSPAAQEPQQPAAHAAPPPQAPAAAAAPRRPGAATVVRMIDREKLMERVPSRRLGGSAPTGDRRGPPGSAPRPGVRDAAPGQRFGQVTELKVVTDPFGRGREMVNVAGRDKKGRPGATPAKPVKKDRPPSKRDLIESRERAMHPSRLKKKKSMKSGVKKTELTERKASKRVIRMKADTIVVADLAHQLGVKATDIISKLMSLGTMASQNQSIPFETAQLVAADYEYTVDSSAFDEEGALEDVEAVADDASLKPRPPVVTVMGHVDHGKTSLLDAIRKADVAAGEAGGITQHIGAYSVQVPGKGSITFLDTPGHAAFTNMRARGAQVTDLVVLVVAADDGVMPQTEEAIKHAQAAKVPIIVAVNKIDKPDAQPERVMQELSKFELVSEAWGGQTLFVNTSATKGTGVPELLEAILLQAEILELKANPDRAAIGVVLEAKLDKGRGPVATVLIQQGTMKRGDAIVVGELSGKVRAMTDHAGKSVDVAPPSAAIEITGLEGVPEAGDAMHVVDSAEKAREIAEHRLVQKRAAAETGQKAMTLEDMMKRMSDNEQLELKVVLKADVQGSVEAVRDALVNLSTPEVKVTVVYGGVGAVKESDISLAAASKGIVIGFGVRPDANSRTIAEREGVEIRTYNIIYEALDDIRLAMQGLLAPESREKVLGHAEVREVFKVTKVGTIAGCRVQDGKAARSARVRILRDSVQVFDGKVSSLKHFKNDVREIEAGQECGVGVDSFNDIKVGDVIEFYMIEEIARTLQPAAPAPGKRPGGGASAHP